MTRHVTHLLSVVFFVFVMAFAAIPATHATGPSLPNREQGDASGVGQSTTQVCRASFLAPRGVAVISTTTAPANIATAMILVEQDSGTVYASHAESTVAQPGASFEMASGGCFSPA